MLDLVGSQIVGFLMHRLMFNLYHFSCIHVHCVLVYCLMYFICILYIFINKDIFIIKIFVLFTESLIFVDYSTFVSLITLTICIMNYHDTSGSKSRV